MGVPYAEVIGDPIAHSKSPLIHKFWLEKLGIEGDYRATRVTAEELQDYFAARRADPDWRGCNVTMPLKEATLAKLDTVTRNARQIGAINTVRRGRDGRLHGRNTDVHGVARSLDHLLGPSMVIVLIGAGGAARAAAYVLASYRPREVTVVNRSLGRARRLLQDFRLQGGVTADTMLPAADLLINAAPPYAEFHLGALTKDAVVFDMVYSPPVDSVLAAARRMGLRTVDGLTMLTHQAAEAFAVFFRHSRPAYHDAELRELLTR